MGCLAGSCMLIQRILRLDELLVLVVNPRGVAGVFSRGYSFGTGDR